VSERLLRATLTYSAPFEAVALRGAAALAGRGGGSKMPTFDYLAVHIRGDDGGFVKNLKATIRHAFEFAGFDLAKARRRPGPVTLYVATDVKPAQLRGNRDFKDAVARLGAQAAGANATAAQQKAAVKLAFLHDAVGDPAKALQAAAAGAEFPVNCVPDLEMHLVRTGASEDFGRTAQTRRKTGPADLRQRAARLRLVHRCVQRHHTWTPCPNVETGSSMSLSIRTLRDFILAERRTTHAAAGRRAETAAAARAPRSGPGRAGGTAALVQSTW
jgi:hypothetical protein